MLGPPLAAPVPLRPMTTAHWEPITAGVARASVTRAGNAADHAARGASVALVRLRQHWLPSTARRLGRQSRRCLAGVAACSCVCSSG
eukprot:1095042-Prymnesium_polylepis.2